MIRRLIRDSSIYTVSKVLYQGLPILLVPLFTRFLSKAELKRLTNACRSAIYAFFFALSACMRSRACVAAVMYSS